MTISLYPEKQAHDLRPVEEESHIRAFYCQSCGRFVATVRLGRRPRNGAGSEFAAGFLSREGCLCSLADKSLLSMVRTQAGARFAATERWHTRLREALTAAGVHRTEALAVTRAMWPLSPQRKRQIGAVLRARRSVPCLPKCQP